MAQFMVINNRMEIRAHEWQNLDQLTKWPFQTILGLLQLQT